MSIFLAAAGDVNAQHVHEAKQNDVPEIFQLCHNVAVFPPLHLSKANKDGNLAIHSQMRLRNQCYNRFKVREDRIE